MNWFYWAAGGFVVVILWCAGALLAAKLAGFNGRDEDPSERGDASSEQRASRNQSRHTRRQFEEEGTPV